MTRATGEPIVFKCTSDDQLPVLVSGDVEELGGWQAEKAVAMQPSVGGPNVEWSAVVILPLGQTFEFKFIKRGQAGVIWETGNNRRYTIISGHHTMADTFRS